MAFAPGLVFFHSCSSAAPGNMFYFMDVNSDAEVVAYRAAFFSPIFIIIVTSRWGLFPVPVWCQICVWSTSSRRVQVLRDYVGILVMENYPDKKSVGFTLLFCPSSIALFFSVMRSDVCETTSTFFDLLRQRRHCDCWQNIVPKHQSSCCISVKSGWIYTVYRRLYSLMKCTSSSDAKKTD